jgi:hypothetical protein
MNPIRTALLAAVLLSMPGAAGAHELWLERDGNIVHGYFGEPAENLREKTGGLLDRLTGPRAFATDPRQGLPLARKADNFEIAAPASATDVRLVEETMKPFSRPGVTEVTRTVMLAREGRHETKSVMELELVPAAPDGDVFTLLLRGQPVPKAEVVLVGPPLWEKHLRTDEKGQVRFETPWAGRYIAAAVHVDKTPGGTGEGAYTQQRFVSTISFVARSGLPWTAR